MRKRFRRRIQYNFNDTYFKPRGKPLSTIEEVTLSDEELETLRLRYVKRFPQERASKEMRISQSQYQRDITKALEKITDALIEGKAIKIEKRQDI